MRCDVSRRSFIWGGLATFGGVVLPSGAFGSRTPNMKLGVVSDVHISSRWRQELYLEKALRWFDAQGVDAVMAPGDLAQAGLISELEKFAAVWDKVFPGDKGADGRHVEKLFVTGNHDLDAWWTKGKDEWREKNVFNHADNAAKVWKRLFHKDWQLIWKKEVKGYVFVGAQWPTKAAPPPVEAWFREHAGELAGARPFFYTQHAHPKGTCGDGKISHDRGEATRALSPFPNAVAITGHSHQTIVDESSMWQGAFTSINAGCLRGGDNDRHGCGYDSTYPSYSSKKKLNKMKPLPAEEGRCGLLVDIFDDHLVVHRRSFEYDVPLGDDWCVALPAAAGGPFDPARQRKESAGPEFAPDAKVEVVRCAVTPKDIAGPALHGKPCVQVKIPHPRAPKPGSRVYDFDVKMLVDGKCAIRRLVLANGYNVPEAMSDRPSNCLFGVEEVPASGDVRFSVTPRNAFGVSGRTLVSSPLT
ncbi:MAG: metallophosphoesterase [Kiritimatiellae bacterium]|nr:metallophosphoesterase [Kiritimatiellia bacterium]